MSIRQRSLLIVVLGPILTVVVVCSLAMRIIGISYEEAAINESRGIVFKATSAYKEIVRKLDTERIRSMDQNPKDKPAQAVPVIIAIPMVRDNAGHPGFDLRAPMEQPRHPHRAPTPEEARVLGELRDKHLAELVVKDGDSIQYFQAIRLATDCLYCHGALKGRSDPVGGIKEGWRDGELCGAFEILTSLDRAKQQAAEAAIVTKLSILGLLAVLVALAWWWLQSDGLGALRRFKACVRPEAGGGPRHRAPGQVHPGNAGARGAPHQGGSPEG